MTDTPRLVERAFPLRQASLDSVHEKNVRHGHISTLHIWPARRPLAASRAALLATLLPDPGTPEGRREIVERIGGTITTRTETKKIGERKIEVIKHETAGGILRWGRENGPDIEWARTSIREAFGGRAPRVLDPFSGGGAIPVEAMRLGCETTALELNPVAWMVLRCTLEYPHRLHGQTRSLPGFALQDREFVEGYLKSRGFGASRVAQVLEDLGLELNDAPLLTHLGGTDVSFDTGFAWHLRAWGRRVLSRASSVLGKLYGVHAERPPLAFLWARTVRCKNCRLEVPLLKTRWLSKKGTAWTLLNIAVPDGAQTVSFTVEQNVRVPGNNAAQRRENARRMGAGTMSRSGARCPRCAAIHTMEDLRLEGQAGRLGTVMTAVVVQGPRAKEYRAAGAADVENARAAEAYLPDVAAKLPFGLPGDPLASSDALGFRVPLYGFDQWDKLFTPRQLVALGTFVDCVRQVDLEMQAEGYDALWREAMRAYLGMVLDRLADRSSALCRPDPTPTQSGVINTFSRFALPMNWDFIEGVTTADSSGGFGGALDWVAKVVDRSADYATQPAPSVLLGSAISDVHGKYDAIVTDPPYYDAIAYSDLMDFFYVWLRRSLAGTSPEIDSAFSSPLGPKWDGSRADGELIDDSSRHGGNRAASKRAYEEGMFRVLRSCADALVDDGRLVIVFAHKHPDAWETLVSAIIRAGFVVDGSWPIQTEMGNRTRAISSAALSSSVWLVCRKRPAAARPGWDNRVLEEMRTNIKTRLREYWDAGIRGPDFVWAATGPALEAYSNHPVVKKANEPGAVMNVSEFLRAVRRIVVDFVVGRVLPHSHESEVTGLDDVTTYYLLHRNDFKMADAPIGPCILYAVSCGLSDAALADTHDLLVRTGGQAAEPEEADEDEDVAEDGDGEAEESGSGATVKLKPWNQRKRPSMGFNPAVDSPRARRAREAPALAPEFEAPLPRAREIPLIDQVHRLMHLWKAGDVAEVDGYLDARALRKNPLFHHLLQALIELADAGSEERSILESLSNHVATRGVALESPQLEAGV